MFPCTQLSLVWHRIIIDSWQNIIPLTESDIYILLLCGWSPHDTAYILANNLHPQMTNVTYFSWTSRGPEVNYHYFCPPWASRFPSVRIVYLCNLMHINSLSEMLFYNVPPQKKGPDGRRSLPSYGICHFSSARKRTPAGGAHFLLPGKKEEPKAGIQLIRRPLKGPRQHHRQFPQGKDAPSRSKDAAPLPVLLFIPPVFLLSPPDRIFPRRSRRFRPHRT